MEWKNLQLCLIGLVLVKLAELKSTTHENRPSPPNDLLIKALKLITSGENSVSSRVFRSRSADSQIKASNQMLDNDEPRQFCGETLYYVVEYYCVYVKGTSVYVPSEDDDTDSSSSDEAAISKRDIHDDDGLENLFFALLDL